MKRTLCACLALLILLLPSALAEPPPDISPTTGLPSATPYRPVLVQLGNSEESRPPTGLALADIVYESIYWGPSHTIYLALFNDHHPDTVGYVYPSRLFWFEMQTMWDCPFVYRGTQGRGEDKYTIKAFVKEHAVADSLLFDGSRSNSKDVVAIAEDLASPFSVMVNVAALAGKHWPTDAEDNPHTPSQPALKFSQTPSQSDRQARLITVAYDEEQYTASYVYDEERAQYARWYNRQPQRDADGTEILAANVIVQYVSLSFEDADQSLPIVETTGQGSMDAFIGGHHIRGTWARDDVTDWITYLDEAGDEIVLLPGSTYIQMVPLDMTIDVEDETGAVFHYGTDAP